MKKGGRCSYCNSRNTVKSGKRKNKNSNKQIMLCKDCNKRFTDSNEFSRMRYQPSVIETALSLATAGMSLAIIKTKLDEEYRSNIPRKTILYWVHKYAELRRVPRSKTSRQAVKRGRT